MSRSRNSRRGTKRARRDQHCYDCNNLGNCVWCTSLLRDKRRVDAERGDARSAAAIDREDYSRWQPLAGAGRVA